MEQIQVAAHAKINLTLDILSRRPDGYHDVAMVMQSVSLHDGVTVRLTQSGKIDFTTDSGAVPKGPENLAVRAAALFFEKSGIENPGVHIAIQKRIPVAAGLAGGSADAAGVLTALRALFTPEMPLVQLAEIGLALGADIPFCMRGSTMLAHGVGEVLSPLAPMPRCQLVLAKPRIGVSTAAAYAAFDKTGCLTRPDAQQMADALKSGSLAGVAQNLCNVFEQVMELPVVNNIKEQMTQCGALGACMSGSGPTVFGLFDDEEKAEACRSALALLPETESVFLCRPVPFGCRILDTN